MIATTVPILSIFFMLISAFIGFGLPVGLYLFWYKKYKLRIVPVLVGAAGFILFAMILEQIIHIIVLKRDTDGTLLLANNPFLYVLYSTMAAGIFEETARFLFFHLLKRKYQGFGTSLAYGIGHGGVEAIFLLGFTMVNNIIFSVMINTGASEALGNTTQITNAIEVLKETAPPVFLIGGLERISAITIHISLSVLLWFAVNKKGKMWLYPAAILLHALVNVPAALMQCGVLKNIIFMEVIVIISAAALAFLVNSLRKHWLTE